MAKTFKNGYESQLVSKDIITADVTTGSSTDTFYQIGSFEVPFGQAVELGLGVNAGYDNARGRLYADLKDAVPADVDGMVRIVMYNATRTKSKILWQGRTEKLRAGTADDRQSQIPFPQTGVVIPEKYFIDIEFKPDAGGSVVSAANSTVLIDCIQYDYE